MRKKDVYKFLEKESKQLPSEWYIVKHSFPNEVVKENLKFKIDNADVVTEDDYYYEMKYAVNHGRRLKTEYNNNGWDGVHKYFYQRGFVLKIKNPD